jgi:hypothetical protein
VTAALVLAALVAAAYANSLSAEFLLDNRPLVLEDPRLRAATGSNLALIFTRDYWWPHYMSEVYRPLTTLSYLLNYAVLGNGDRPAGYHVVNLLLHWGNAVLVYLLALAAMRGVRPAFWTAALFALHPIATEAVTNVVGRADLLAALGVLGGTLLHARAGHGPGRRAVPRLAGLAAATALGVLSKESAAVLPAVMALFDLTAPRRVPERRRSRAVAAGYVVVLGTLLAVWLVRTRVFAALPQAHVPFVDNPLVAADFWTARLTAVGVMGRYFWLLLWPSMLSCDYSYDQIPLAHWPPTSPTDWQPVLVLGLLVAVVVAAIRLGRREPAVPFFVGFFFVTLLPVANLLRIIGSIMAERFLYLPALGFTACLVLVVTWLAGRLGPRPGAAALALAVVVALYGLRTHRRNADWHDVLALWSSAVVAAPNSFKTHQGMAYALWVAGEPHHPDIDAVIREAEAARAILERKPLPDVHKPSVIPLELGIYYEAKAAALRPPGDDAVWYRKAADVLAEAARLDRVANEENRRRQVARGKRPSEVPDIGNQSIYYHLGLVHARLSEQDQALAALTTRCRLLGAADPAACARQALARLGGAG